MTRRALRGARLVDPTAGLDERGTIVVENGRITALHPPDEEVDAEVVDELQGCWVLPGLVELRCHLGEPGLEHREDLRSGLRAAAAGGYTTVCPTPDTAPPIDRAAVVAQLLDRRRELPGPRLQPAGAATAGLQHRELAPMGELAEAGCVAFATGEHPVADAERLRRVLEYARSFDRPLLSAPGEPTLSGLCDEGRWSSRLGLAPEPATAEVLGAHRELALAELTGHRLHLHRLSTAEALALVERARARGAPVSCDVTPHHLHLTAASLASYDPATRIRPPLRAERDRDALRDALSRGPVDAVSSDHRPRHAEESLRPFAEIPPGVGGLETTLPLMLALVREAVITPWRLVELLSAGPRRILGLPAAGLRAGDPADLTALDPEAPWTPDERTLHSRGRNTPFRGTALQGRARLTLVDGAPVHDLVEGPARRG